MNLVIYRLTTLPFFGKRFKNYIKKSLKRFINYYEWTENRDLVKKKKSVSASKYSSELTNNGIVTIPKLFSEKEFLKDILEIVEELSVDYNKLREELDEEKIIKINKDKGVEFWYSTIDRSGKRFGRDRFYFPEDSPYLKRVPLKLIATNPIIQEIGEEVYGIGTKPKGYMIEILNESKDSDSWHIDNCYDQLKAMIFLTNVTEENGPMKYKLKTHKPESNIVKTTIYDSATKGLDYGYPPYPIIEKMQNEEIKATGKAGDCVFFNTLGIHSGSRCIEGRRIAIIVYYRTISSKNLYIKDLLRS